MRAVREALPALRWLHHSPNGGLRDARVGGQMKALGCKPGFPDLILPVPSDGRSGCVGWTGLAIEMKTSTGRTSVEQDEWLAHLEQAGWRVAVCRSAAQARDELCAYLAADPRALPELP